MSHLITIYLSIFPIVVNTYYVQVNLPRHLNCSPSDSYRYEENQCIYPITLPTSALYTCIFPCHLEQLMEKNRITRIKTQISLISYIKILTISFNEVERNIGTREGGVYGTSLMSMNQFNLIPIVADIMNQSKSNDFWICFAMVIHYETNSKIITFPLNFTFRKKPFVT